MIAKYSEDNIYNEQLEEGSVLPQEERGVCCMCRYFSPKSYSGTFTCYLFGALSAVPEKHSCYRWMADERR